MHRDGENLKVTMTDKPIALVEIRKQRLFGPKAAARYLGVCEDTLKKISDLGQLCVFRGKSSTNSDRKSSTIPGASHPVIPTPKHPAFRQEAIQFCGFVGTVDEMPESFVKGR
jgi:hypothetical protein